MATAPSPSPPELPHRDRLLLAMADAITGAGSFPGVTVADVVRRARTSRRTFYEHFDDREACFLALFDEVSERLLTLIAEAAAGDAPVGERIDRGFAAFLSGVAQQPVVSRSCFVDMAGLGERGATRVRRMTERWAHQLVDLVAADPAARPLPLEHAVVVTAGLRDLVIARLDAGDDLADLQGIGGDLLRRLTT